MEALPLPPQALLPSPSPGHGERDSFPLYPIPLGSYRCLPTSEMWAQEDGWGAVSKHLLWEWGSSPSAVGTLSGADAQVLVSSCEHNCWFLETQQEPSKYTVPCQRDQPTAWLVIYGNCSASLIDDPPPSLLWLPLSSAASVQDSSSAAPSTTCTWPMGCSRVLAMPSAWSVSGVH